MRMICDKTSNIIDLAELRRRQDRCDSLARRPEEGLWVPEEASGFRPVVLTATREERRRARRARRERLAWRLEACACLSVILMAAAFTLRILI